MKISEREVNHIREELSSIIRNVTLIKRGKPYGKVSGRPRIFLIQEKARELDEFFKKL